jgi:acetoin utilization deacetylase AcuC-like enzyme/ankyrin repeat protein
MKSGGLALQIVNPSTLGVSYEKRRHRGGGDSPVTPWDGELEALVGTKADDDDSKRGSAIGNNTASQGNRGTVTGTHAKIHPVCGPATAYDRSPVHQAICQRDVGRLQTLLTDPLNRSAVVLQGRDDSGYCPLHSAAAAYMQDPLVPGRMGMSNELVRLILDAGADVACDDGNNNTPLHWAARAGDCSAIEQLLQLNATLDRRNKFDETPLHWALRAGTQGAGAAALLLENGARPGNLDKKFKRPIDVASEGFADEEGSLEWYRQQEKQGQKLSKEHSKARKVTAPDRRDTRANLLIRSAHSRTLVLHHPECLEHHPKSKADWEAPDRVQTIMKRILPSSDPAGTTETSGIFPHEVNVSQDFDRANLDLLSRVHSTEYLSFVNKLSKDLEQKLKDSGGFSASDSDPGTFIASPPPVVPFTPMVQRSMIKIDESSVKLGINSDTSFSAGSLRAARRAAGAVQHAVDWYVLFKRCSCRTRKSLWKYLTPNFATLNSVLIGRNRNAFCVVRPPGHHAGINGLLEGGESCGFCIFNNIAAGALHAIADDRLLCNKCAIVDIDVHHGNGTEEIVRKCNDPSKLFFFSIHLYDNESKKRGSNQFAYKFYPGTGCEDDLAMNIINVPIVPMWKDAATAGSSSGVTKTHNTRHKARNAQDAPNDDSSETSNGNPRVSSKASDNASDAGSSNLNSQSSQAASAATPSGRLAYRKAIQDRLLPALRAFNPDLILISAGFDAAKGDVGNARHERGRERMGLDLEPEDYAWTTRKILEIADICCQGRVVSVLEGGYGRTPPGPAADGEDRPLDRAIFGECAVRHLHSMIDPYDAECRFG